MGAQTYSLKERKLLSQPKFSIVGGPTKTFVEEPFKIVCLKKIFQYW